MSNSKYPKHRLETKDSSYIKACNAFAGLATEVAHAAGLKAKLLRFTTHSGFQHAGLILYYEDSKGRPQMGWIDDANPPKGSPDTWIKQSMPITAYGLQVIPPFEDNRPGTARKVAEGIYARFWHKDMVSMSSAKFIPPGKPRNLRKTPRAVQ